MIHGYCGKSLRVGMDSIGTPPHRRNKFFPRIPSDNDTWSGLRAMMCRYRRYGMVTMSTDSVFRIVCLEDVRMFVHFGHKWKP